MEIIKNVQEWQKLRKELPPHIGFVPTMGALHRGHGSLLKLSHAENAVSVLSIFVNPTQFSDKKDFEKYPVTIDTDTKLAKNWGVDYLLLPQASEIYHDDYRFKLTENKLSTILEGQFRPGHFDGVLSVVLKLFNIVQPSRAYFGEKDYQQLRLIQDMARSLFLPVDVISCETIRESDGLAMSSRNALLSEEARKKAPLIAKYLMSELSNEEVKSRLESEGFEVEYVANEMSRRLIAAKIEGVRLIDNVKK